MVREAASFRVCRAWRQSIGAERTSKPACVGSRGEVTDHFFRAVGLPHRPAILAVVGLMSGSTTVEGLATIADPEGSAFVGLLDHAGNAEHLRVLPGAGTTVDANRWVDFVAFRSPRWSTATTPRSTPTSPRTSWRSRREPSARPSTLTVPWG
jgi:hypothetical protein